MIFPSLETYKKELCPLPRECGIASGHFCSLLWTSVMLPFCGDRKETTDLGVWGASASASSCIPAGLLFTLIHWWKPYHVTTSASLKLPFSTQDDLCPERDASPGFSSLYPVLHPGYCSGTLPLESCPFLLPSFAPSAFQLPLLHPFPTAPQMHSRCNQSLSR